MRWKFTYDDYAIKDVPTQPSFTTQNEKAMMGDMSRPITDETMIRSTLSRRLEATFPPLEQTIQRLAAGKSLRVYLGIDPTGLLHIGHLVPLLLLNDLLTLGHRPVIVIGDFTALVGDPTGKDKTRVALTEAQIRENMQGYLDQIKKVLPEFDVEYNSRWLKPLSFADLIRLTSHMTVQQMIARDMFQQRLKEEKPIYVHEFLYPLMQGYDSVAMEIDGEVGGNDQTFNMLVGRDLEREYLKKEKLVFAIKLLVDPVSGKKMSKTEDNFIPLTDTPQEIRRKVLNFPDELIATVFQLCTNADLAAIPQDHRAAKEQLADELIRMLQGTSAVDDARKPIEIEGQGTISKTAYIAGVVPSMSMAKDLISQKAVKLNGVIVEDWNMSVKSGDNLQVGKGKFYKIK